MSDFLLGAPLKSAGFALLLCMPDRYAETAGLFWQMSQGLRQGCHMYDSDLINWQTVDSLFCSGFITHMTCLHCSAFHQDVHDFLANSPVTAAELTPSKL